MTTLAATSAAVGQMDVLMVSEFLISILTLLFWMDRCESKSGRLGFALCLLALGVFAFVQGAWPVGSVMFVLSASATSQLMKRKNFDNTMSETNLKRNVFSHGRFSNESMSTSVYKWN